MLDVFLDSIEDNNTRDVLRTLLENLQQIPWLNGTWAFKEISVDSAVTNHRVPHRLGFKPKDAVLLSKTGSSTVSINYDHFDDTYIDITTSGATTIRLIVGTYNEEQ